MNQNPISRYGSEPKVEIPPPLLSHEEHPLMLTCPTVKPQHPLEAPVEDRQGRVPGFSQQALSNLTVLLFGAGALGGEIAEGLVREGVGTLKIFDPDTVALSNLNRQFFFPKDLYQPKAWALARNLAPHGAMGTRIIAWPVSFERAYQLALDLDGDLAIAAVDSGPSRIEIARFAVERKIPALFGGASITADYANLFVQQVGSACYACAFPEEARGKQTPCPGSPAIKALFKHVAGLALYAVESLFMDRPRNWNLYTLCPSDATFTRSGWVNRRPDCPICGGERSNSG